MRAFWEELRDLASHSDFLAILLISLLLGWGPQLGRLSMPDGWGLPVVIRPGGVSFAIPIQEVLEELRRELRLLR